jgi:hypothetical protein
MKIIGICGLIGSGKGTVADILQQQHGFTKISFADSLKDAVSAVFGWPRYLLEGDTEPSREFREQVDQWWADRLGIPDLTPRLMLQIWGTEVCRESFHRDIWIASMERKLANTDRNYVIPDVRFPNEVEMIQRVGGKIWHIKRGETPAWFIDYIKGAEAPADIHPSEYSWARSQFDAFIRNDGPIEQLQGIIYQFVG